MTAISLCATLLKVYGNIFKDRFALFRTRSFPKASAKVLRIFLRAKHISKYFSNFFSILLAFLYNDLKYRQLHIPSYFLFFLHISCIKQAIIVYHAVFTASIKWNKKVYKALNPQNPSRRHPHPTPYYIYRGSISKDQCNAASSPLMGRRISPVRIIRIHIFRYCKSFLGSILLHRISGTALQKS